jgi:hypothetical protein
VLIVFFCSQIIIGGVNDNLNMQALNISANPANFEYVSQKFPTTSLQILNDTYPFDLFPAAFQLPSGLIYVQSGIESALINPNDNTIDYTTIPKLDPPTTRPLVYPCTWSVCSDGTGDGS